MNICLLSDKFPPEKGGLAVSAARLTHGLRAAGHTVTACIVDQSVEAGQVVHNKPQDVIRVGKHRRDDDTFAAWFDCICDLHTAHPFDIIHAYYAVNAGFVGVFAARYLGVPNIVSVRGNDLDRSVFHPGKHVLWTIAHADAITAVTSDLARKARAIAIGIPVKVIFNSEDTERIHPGASDERITADLYTERVPLVGFVGEARQKKGIDPLLHAWQQVITAVPAARLLLIGDVRKEAKALLHEYADDSIWEVRPIQHHLMPAAYNLLDVLVVPSLRDGLPNVLLEGMACGCDVVGSAGGGMVDVIARGENGLLVPKNDPEALAAAITELLNNPDQRQRLGRAARDHIVPNFTLPREVEANVTLYEQLLVDR